MNRLVFEVQAPVIAADPNRADIACFVGFVARRKNPVPLPVLRWLEEQDWIYSVRNQLNQIEYKLRYQVTGDVAELLDIPVPIDSWEVFDHLFEWERRVLSRRVEKSPSNTSSAKSAEAADERIIEHFGTTYLGAAVRSFFAQGGRKCYVVRVGDPWTYLAKSPPGLAPKEARAYAQCRRVSQIRKLIPGFQLPGDCFSQELPPDAFADHLGLESSPVEQSSWHGIGHLFGLPEVSFLCLPDLADAVRVEEEPIDPVEFPLPDKIEFVECSAGEEAQPNDSGARSFRAPRCDDDGYAVWASALRLAANLIATRGKREVQLVAAVPIPSLGSAAERDLYVFLTRTPDGPLSQGLSALPPWLASAFVQLAYPWVRTPGSVDLPEQLESPDAVLAGLLARNALTRGAFHSAATLHLADVYDLFPVVRRSLIESRERPAPQNHPSRTFLERVSLFGPTPAGLKLLSDVTTSLDESYRPAGINRLVSSIVRAARRLGEESTFESSGESLWDGVRDRLTTMLSGLRADGGLTGESDEDAFHVRCDRSTMNQNDIDNGRVVAEIRFQAAAPIEQITIVLALDEGGQVSLISARIPDQMKEAA